jgi:hypothetical protein
MAAIIAGLVAAADIARQNGDRASAARWESTADFWRSSLASWTFTTNGFSGGYRYFERIDPTQDPNGPETLHFEEGDFFAHDVADFGFLDLARLGVVALRLSAPERSVRWISPDVRWRWTEGVVAGGVPQTALAASNPFKTLRDSSKKEPTVARADFLVVDAVLRNRSPNGSLSPSALVVHRLVRAPKIVKGHPGTDAGPRLAAIGVGYAQIRVALPRLADRTLSAGQENLRRAFAD